MILRSTICMLVLMLTTFLFAEDRGSVKVNITDINYSQGGDIIISIYDSDKTWLKIPEALISYKEELNGRKDVTYTFQDIIFDSVYAVSVIHDKNKNGKFDMKWFPFPRPAEGACVSNNDKRNGPPKYKIAKFTHNTIETVINVNMVY